ncbi:hypothetical protein COCON_G00048020 [Conger conger]|uniref:Uncharacterized protein n=1 Tax=Conger conger TaxID=82655 RepID=A0A9Q1I5C7_CONCO|nr:hypothetical protein COCON_G00048020 [Conger conger]
MMRYTILIFTLLHYSWGTSFIFDQIRGQLEDLSNKSFNFNTATLSMPHWEWKSCDCETIFVEDLKMVLESVKSFNKTYEEKIDALLDNLNILKSKIKNKRPEDVSCNVKKHHHRLLKHNIRFIQRWYQNCDK